MRVCSACGSEVEPTGLFCPRCGAKAPAGAATDASPRVQGNVDPLASTSPATRSPAAGQSPFVPPRLPPVSPLAGTAVVAAPARSDRALPSASPQSPPAPARSTRGKTAPLSALPSDKVVVTPPQAATAPTFGSPSGASGRGSPAPPAGSGARLPADAGRPGKRVLVQWANGQRYPGVVEQVNGPLSLVRFDVGELRWVETRYVRPAG